MQALSEQEAETNGEDHRTMLDCLHSVGRGKEAWAATDRTLKVVPTVLGVKGFGTANLLVKLG